MGFCPPDEDPADLPEMVNDLVIHGDFAHSWGMFRDKDLQFIEDMAGTDLTTITVKQADYIRSLHAELLERALPLQHALERDD